MSSDSTLSRSQAVGLGLAILIGGVVWRAAEKFSDARVEFDKTLNERLSGIESRFLSKDVFTTEMEALRREAGMRQDEMMRRLDAVERRIEGPK